MKLVNGIKRKQTHRYREQTTGYQYGEVGVSQNTCAGMRGSNCWVWDRLKDVLQNKRGAAIIVYWV